ncbi:MAG: N-acetylmuramoyl-L-alanine amidase [Vampirovibrionales bacterium]|nr:N-acetylmuramoyl-L-alanine amidase [Vampirovibrionales bacterium]
MPDAPAHILCTYPAHGHQTAEASTFVMGHCQGARPNGATLNVLNHNDDRHTGATQACRVDLLDAASGFFCHKVVLKPGLNRVELTLAAADETALASTQIAIYRSPVTPEPATLSWLWPTPDTSGLAACAGETLDILVLGPAHQALVATLNGPQLDHKIRLNALASSQNALANAQESFWDNRSGIFAHLHHAQPLIHAACVYHASIKLPAMAHLPEFNTTPEQTIDLTLSIGPETQALSLPPLTRELTLWRAPRTLIVKAPAATCRVAPSPAAARQTAQPAGAILHARALCNGYYQVSATPPVWVAQAECTPEKSLKQSLNASPEFIPANGLKPLRVINVTHEPNRITLTFDAFGAPVIWHLIAQPCNFAEAYTLELTACNTAHHCDFIRYAPDLPDTIGPITCQQLTPENVKITVPVYGALKGIAMQQQGERTTIALLRLPAKPTDWLIGLDAGHGGEETGALAPDGTPEKTLNLVLARACQTALQAAGFKTCMSRDSDEFVSLAERAERLAHCDVIFSLHHNALPDGRDPALERGLSTYYYHPWAQPLARKLLQTLPQACDLPAYGVLFDSLAMTRIDRNVAILIEAGFLTHPAEAAQLLDPAFAETFAQGLVQALLTA